MTNVADLSRVNQWLRQVLTDDLQLNQSVSGRVYADEAPQGAAAPMVVYAFLGGADRLLTSRSSRLSSALYLIRGIADGSSYDPVEPIADRIEAVLTLPDEGTVVRGVRLMSCQREQPHQRKDASFGKPSVYMGGFYRLKFSPA